MIANLTEGQYEAMRRRALQAEMRALDAEDVAATAAAELEEAKGNAARLKAQLEGDGFVFSFLFFFSFHFDAAWGFRFE